MDTRQAFQLGVQIGALRESLVSAAVGDTESAQGDIVTLAVEELLGALESTPAVADELDLRRREEAIEVLSHWLERLFEEQESPSDLDRRQAFHLLSDLEIYLPQHMHMDSRRMEKILKASLNQ